MKKLIIFTDVVSGYGGAQLLIARRTKHLEAQGIKTYIVVRRHLGAYPLEDEYGDTPILYQPIIDRPFSLVRNKQKESLVLQIRLFVKDVDAETIVESHSMQECVWAEYFSSKVGVRHVFYSIDGAERFSHYLYYPYKDFFFYKYKKHEIAALTPYSLSVSLDRETEYDEDYLRVPFDPQEILDTTIPVLEKSEPNETIRISTITRLDKFSFIPFIDDVVNHARHTDRKIVLSVYGSCTNKSLEKEIKSRYEGVKFSSNLTIKFIGQVKMGRDLFEYTDVYFGIGTAVLNAASQKIPSVVINIDNNGLSYCIFGVDTKEFALCQDADRTYNISEIITRVMSKERGCYSEDGYRLVIDEYTLSAFEKRYNNFLKSTLTWYNFDNITYITVVKDLFIHYALKFYHTIRKYYGEHRNK